MRPGPGAGAARGRPLVVTGGRAGVGARVDELDALALALADATSDCGALVADVVRAAAAPALDPVAVQQPWHVLAVVRESAAAVALLCRAAADLAALASAVAATVHVYRTREAALEGAVRAVPLVVGPAVRVPLLLGAATVVVPGAADRWGEQLVARPGLVDVLVRLAPGVVGLPGVTDVRGLARVASVAGATTGRLVETDVGVTDAGTATCSAPARGVADLLRRGQTVASWREPGPGAHDTLPPGAERPVRGQVRVDRVTGPGGEVAWVVHVPGTQEWDGDGEGSPMDMAGNVSLVAGRSTAVSGGVARAMVLAGVRPGQPVAVVGHSQGGMTAVDLAADEDVRRVATITHVVTAGSPVAGRTPPPGVQVLAIEHPEDLVPRLDGRAHPDRADRTTVRAAAPDGPWRTDAVPAHSSSAYVATAELLDASDDPSLVAYREGLAPFLAREGATCTTRHLVLRRTGDPA